MNPEPENSARSFEGILSPYLDHDGVGLAMLVSTDGLLIAAAGSDDFDREALAAYSAAALSAAVGMAEELDTDMRGTVALDLQDIHLILAPLTADLFLLLIGGRG
jgi:predicted regulator of Ras-like GTPase activity (Roadblock/LC7/MglB family)